MSEKRKTKKIFINFKTLFYCLLALITMELSASIILNNTQLHHLLVTGISRLFQILVLIIIVVFFNNGLKSIGLNYYQIIEGIKKGLIWSFCFGILTFCSFLILLIWYKNPLSLIHTNLPKDNFILLLSFIVGGVIGPVCEEIFFRGILYGFFRKWSVFFAILLSTLIFVLLHPIRTSIPIPQIIGGVIFAISYEKTGMLMTPITIHILGNTAIFLLSLFQSMRIF